MPPISTTDALEAGLELGKSPPRAADGGPELSPAPVSLPVIQPMSLCELGPCRRYHVMRQKVDAERPIDGSPAPIYTAVIKTCYPSEGVEYDLTGEPIKECNRWTPLTREEALEPGRGAHERFTSPTGSERAAYEAFRRSWGEEDPIPEGVYYAIDVDNFYDRETKKGRGVEFYEKWKSRAREFPPR